MRVFTNILLLLSIVVLGLSAWLGPRFRADRDASIDTSSLLIADPMARARLGEQERALGLTLRGYEAVLKADPTNAEATNGIMRAAVRLSAVAMGQQGISHILLGAFEQYVGNRAVTDPDGEQLNTALGNWIELRRHHEWFLARAAVGMWLAARGDARGIEDLDDLSRKGPFWREYFPYVQRYRPDWGGVEAQVRHWLEGSDLMARIYAGVTLMTYRRLYGVGDDLWSRHKRAIGDALLESASAMRPNPDHDRAETPGGLTLLGLALFDSPTTDRMIKKMQPIEHPYLGRVVILAKLWSGAMPFSDVDFDNRRYEVELQLGKSDESHIIRTIEYWAIERKRYPQYDHTAVIVAEDITSRFLNVISLFNGFIPLVAIQMNAIEISGSVSLVFTTVLDHVVLGLVEEDEYDTYEEAIAAGVDPTIQVDSLNQASELGVNTVNWGQFIQVLINKSNFP